jgi:hypothetical protein
MPDFLTKSGLIGGAVCLLLAMGACPPAVAQTAGGHGIGRSRALPYEGSVDDALRASAAGATIPMSRYGVTAGKDGHRYNGTIVGAGPATARKVTTKVNVLVVPVIVHIGATVFNPSAIDTCINAKTTPLAATLASPLFKNAAFDGKTGAGHAAKMNGVDVGTTTYADAVRRGEFWADVHGTNYHTAFTVSVAAPWTISAATVNALGGGNVIATHCAKIGVLPTDAFRNYISNTVIPGIHAIKPTAFVLFLMKDVVTTSNTPLNCAQFCDYGYHAAIGTPVQTFAVSEYDTTLHFWNSPGVRDIAPLSHEISEWLDDPLVTNPTPLWGGIGEVSDGCQSNWEPGDPLTGHDYPAIAMPGGVTYHPQELAFQAWYYNSHTQASPGAGRKFSSNGTLSGPAKPCPPGGTY